MIEVRASEIIDTMFSKMEKNASDLIDELYKEAKEYLQPIVCENCGYEGKPEVDGRCPECGAMEGIKPSETKNTQDYNDVVSPFSLDSIPAHEMGSSNIDDTY